MTTRGLYWSGVGLTFLYILIASAQSVALNVWLHGINVFLVVGLCFSVVTITFAIIGFIWQKSAYAEILSNWRYLVALNLVSVSNWLLYFFAVKYLEPSVAVTLTQGAGPVSMALYTLLRRERISAVTQICSTIIFVTVFAMCVYVVTYRHAYSQYERSEMLIGIALAVVCGVSITATVLLSKRFAAHQIPAAALLSVRFPLLILVCILALPLQQDLVMTGHIFTVTLVIALIGVCGSTYCLQKGIERAPPLAVATVLALSPLAVFLIQLSNPRIPFSAPILGMITLICIVSVVSIFHDANKIDSSKEGSVAKN